MSLINGVQLEQPINLSGSFTGSFSGSITSASYASIATSASYAITASYILIAQTASYFSGSIVSASYALNSTNAQSSSYAGAYTLTSSFISASASLDARINALNSQSLDSTPLTANVATSGSLRSSTYNNGASGVGATITSTANGSLGIIDLFTPLINDRILIKDEVSQLKNGLYELTQTGSSVTPFILTRTVDSDEPSEFSPQLVIIATGSLNIGLFFSQTTDTPTIGTDNIVYASLPYGNTYLSQQTTGTQLINQIPIYTNVSKSLTKGSSTFTYISASGTFRIRNIPYVWPSVQGANGTTLKNNGSGTLTWSNAFTGSFSGSLIGSASYATTSSRTTSASYAETASYVLLAQTASYALSGNGNFTGSFSGSFIGPGTTQWTGSGDISRLGNVLVTGSFLLSGSIGINTLPSAALHIYNPAGISTLLIGNIADNLGGWFHAATVGAGNGFLFQAAGSTNDTTLYRAQILGGGGGDFRLFNNLGNVKIQLNGAAGGNHLVVENDAGTGGLEVQSDGTSVVYQNLGIGNAIPTSKLHIKGTTSDTSSYSVKVEDSTSNSLFVIRNDGKVGLGTITPASKLQIYDSTKGLLVGRTSSPTFNNAAAFGLNSTYSVIAYKDNQDVESLSSWLWSISEASGAGEMRFWSSSIATVTISARPGGATERIYLKRDDNTDIFYINGVDGTLNQMYNSSFGYALTGSARVYVRGEDNSSSKYALRVDSLSQNPLFTVRNDGINEISSSLIVSSSIGINKYPSASLHIKGLTTGSSTYSLKIEDSASNNSFSVRDDGRSTFGPYGYIESKAVLSPGEIYIYGANATIFDSAYPSQVFFQTNEKAMIWKLYGGLGTGNSVEFRGFGPSGFSSNIFTSDVNTGEVGFKSIFGLAGGVTGSTNFSHRFVNGNVTIGRDSLSPSSKLMIIVPETAGAGAALDVRDVSDNSLMYLRTDSALIFDGLGGCALHMNNAGTLQSRRVVAGGLLFEQIPNIFSYRKLADNMEVAGCASGDWYFIGPGTGTFSPSAKVHIQGNTTGSTNYSLKVENSASINKLFSVRDDGIIEVSGSIGINVFPTASLHIRGVGNGSSTYGLRIDSLNGSSSIYFRDNGQVNISSSLDSGGGPTTEQLRVESTTGNASIFINGANANGQSLWFGYGGVVKSDILHSANSFYIRVLNNIYFRDISTNANKFVLDSTGNGLFTYDITGLQSAQARLHSIGSTNDLSAYSLRADNSSSVSLFNVRNDGLVSISNNVTISGSLSLSSSIWINKNSSSLNSGSRVVSSNLTSSYSSAFYNYVISSGSNSRAGQIMTVWSASVVQFTDVSTLDIGSTISCSFTSSISSSNINLNITFPTDGWNVKTNVNLL